MVQDRRLTGGSLRRKGRDEAVGSIATGILFMPRSAVDEFGRDELPSREFMIPCLEK